MTAAGGSPGAPPTCLVVDASVVIKWHVTEVHSPAALRLLRDDAPALHAPDLVFPEVGNILWKKVRRGDLTEEQARGSVALWSWHPGGSPLVAVAGGRPRDRHAHRTDGL